MKIRVSITAAIAVAILAGCGSYTPGAHDAALVMVPFDSLRSLRTGSAHHDTGRSWMLPEAKAKKSVLLYVADWGTNDLWVYNYKNGKFVGQLTGFDKPYGGCVDAKGDVYFTNFGSGTVVEYAHGGTTPLNTWTTHGEAFGCSIDKANDLAVTDVYSASASQIEVFAKGGSQGTDYSDPSVCYEMPPAGYDDKGDLIVAGSNNQLCELKAGASSMTTLSFDGGSNAFPGGVMWDGKYITIVDQEANNSDETGIYRATLKGSSLKKVGFTILSDTCDGGYDDTLAPFIVGTKNTPVNDRQGSEVVGANLDCTGRVNFWPYTAGGSPTSSLDPAPESPYGQVVSIGQ